MKEQKQTNNGANHVPGGASDPKEKDKSIRMEFDNFLKEGKNQAEFDRRVQKAIYTTQQKLDKKNNHKILDTEKLAKMDESQKLQYQLQKKQKECEILRRKIKIRELKQKLALLILDELEEQNEI